MIIEIVETRAAERLVFNCIFIGGHRYIYRSRVVLTFDHAFSPSYDMALVDELRQICSWQVRMLMYRGL
ncbi:unnamed protein product [Periconia digitata]|uniref:Uncharacterized protein n=1 Tax=Periconia digitata TaxID=1303443 RepID=A0A9W4U741_9PLEO|nr:unnamed protein product [Periconia digitata]